MTYGSIKDVNINNVNSLEKNPDSKLMPEKYSADPISFRLNENYMIEKNNNTNGLIYNSDCQKSNEYREMNNMVNESQSKKKKNN